MAGASTTRRRSARARRRTHRWVDDRCSRCGLTRREAWILDDAARPVLALVWSREATDVCVRPFPPMLGMEPPAPPTRTRAEAFGELPVGPEPPCPDPRAAPALEPDEPSSVERSG